MRSEGTCPDAPGFCTSRPVFGPVLTARLEITSSQFWRQDVPYTSGQGRLYHKSEPRYFTHGPKTRREFLNLLRWNGGSRT